MILEIIFVIALFVLIPVFIWPLYLLIALIRFVLIVIYNKTFGINFDRNEMLYSTLLFPLYDGKRLYYAIKK